MARGRRPVPHAPARLHRAPRAARVQPRDVPHPDPRPADDGRPLADRQRRRLPLPRGRGEGRGAAAHDLPRRPARPDPRRDRAAPRGRARAPRRVAPPREEARDGRRRRAHPHRLVARAEFAITGKVPPKVRRPEGPFGDHYGYYSLEHDYPVLEVDRVFRRRDAIFPATVVGKPRQEDFYIGDYAAGAALAALPARDAVRRRPLELRRHGLPLARGRGRARPLRARGDGLGVPDPRRGPARAHEVPPRDGRAARPARLQGAPRARPRALPVRDGPLRLREPRDGHARLHGPEGERGQQGRPPRPRRRDPRPARGVPRRAPGRGGGRRRLRAGRARRRRGPRTRTTAPSRTGSRADPAVAAWPLVVLADDAAATAKDERAFLWRVFTRFEPARRRPRRERASCGTTSRSRRRS